MAQKYDLTALASVTLRVVAGSEEEAKAMVMDLLNDADTDFIRFSSHWPAERIVAEFSVSGIAVKDTPQ